MQILLRHDLEDHGNGDDRHDLGGDLAEVGAQYHVGDVPGDHGKAERGRQRDAEQKLGAFGEMRAHRSVTLPFMSYGGSSLLAVMVVLGLLMNVSVRRYN